MFPSGRIVLTSGSGASGAVIRLTFVCVQTLGQNLCKLITLPSSSAVLVLYLRFISMCLSNFIIYSPH